MGKLRIDLNKILRQRIGGWKGKLIPGFLIAALERMIHQKELNHLLDVTEPNTGSDFAEALFSHLDLRLEPVGIENIPADGRFIFASNHPLGGLDGIGLVKLLGKKYGDDRIRVLVNDMLMHVEPLRNVFLPINKYGSQGREAAKAIAREFQGDRHIIVFPAGLVSRIQPDGSIQDLTWQKSFVQKAIEHKRDIVPMRFEGLNRMRFYRTAKWRKKLGVKVNIEQAMLPAELCAARGNRFRVLFGKPVTWQSLADRVAAGESPLEIAASLRNLIYTL